MSSGATPPSAVVLGGSIAGSVLALQLARAGWSVTVVDPELDVMADPGAEPRHRPGAPQAVHAHGFGSRNRYELRRRLPEVWDALVEAGGREVPLREMVPPTLWDGGRPEDDDISAVQIRRHTSDRVLATCLAASPARLVPAGASGLLLDRDGPAPVVRGLLLADGSTLLADVTVDAAGRRSPVTGWLSAAGIDQPERRDESIARYYTRHYRIVGERPPLNSGFADIHPFTCHIQLMFLGDADIAQVAMAAHDRDPVLKALRHAEAFDAVLAANEAFAAWYAVLEPVSDVWCLGAFDNRSRSLVDQGRPLALGLHQVGDALAMTNPTRGRGMAMASMAAGALADRLLEDRDPERVALSFEDWRSRVLLPHYRECAVTDTAAASAMRAGLAGRSVPMNAPSIELPDAHPFTSADLERAADHDPDLFRVLLRAMIMLDDERHVASPEVAAWVRRILAEAPEPDDPQPRPTTGLHARSTLEGLLAAYA